MMLFRVLFTYCFRGKSPEKLPFLLSSFVRTQNIAAILNHCPPWQFWSNSFNFSVVVLKNSLMRLPWQGNNNDRK